MLYVVYALFPIEKFMPTKRHAKNISCWFTPILQSFSVSDIGCRLKAKTLYKKTPTKNVWRYTNVSCYSASNKPVFFIYLFKETILFSFLSYLFCLGFHWFITFCDVLDMNSEIWILKCVYLCLCWYKMLSSHQICSAGKIVFFELKSNLMQACSLVLA